MASAACRAAADRLRGLGAPAHGEHAGAPGRADVTLSFWQKMIAMAARLLSKSLRKEVIGNQRCQRKMAVSPCPSMGTLRVGSRHRRVEDEVGVWVGGGGGGRGWAFGSV
jgi:hypothetical protein